MPCDESSWFYKNWLVMPLLLYYMTEEEAEGKQSVLEESVKPISANTLSSYREVSGGHQKTKLRSQVVVPNLTSRRCKKLG